MTQEQRFAKCRELSQQLLEVQAWLRDMADDPDIPEHSLERGRYMAEAGTLGAIAWSLGRMGG